MGIIDRAEYRKEIKRLREENKELKEIIYEELNIDYDNPEDGE